MEKQTVVINTEFIKLDQLLKFSGIAESGAEAKDMILSEIVYVDDELCTMRGKKIRPSNKVRIEFEDGTLEILVEG